MKEYRNRYYGINQKEADTEEDLGRSGMGI
jgi:hypothetical protein